MSVGTKGDVQPQLHPRQSTPSLAPVCSNILRPAQGLGTGGGQEVGRDAGSSHASPLLPTKTPVPAILHMPPAWFLDQEWFQGKSDPCSAERCWGKIYLVSSFPSPAATASCAGRVTLPEGTAQLIARWALLKFQVLLKKAKKIKWKRRRPFAQQPPDPHLDVNCRI